VRAPDRCWAALRSSYSWLAKLDRRVRQSIKLNGAGVATPALVRRISAFLAEPSAVRDASLRCGAGGSYHARCHIAAPLTPPAQSALFLLAVLY